MPMPVKCNKKCQKEKLKGCHECCCLSEASYFFDLSTGSSLGLRVDFNVLAKPDLDIFGFENFDARMPLSIPTSEEMGRCQVLASVSILMSVNFNLWVEPDLEEFGFDFDTFESLSMSALTTQLKQSTMPAFGHHINGFVGAVVIRVLGYSYYILRF
jgi:hypothetical protein